MPGAVQPYGVLLGIHPHRLQVVQVSESIQRHLGVPPEDGLGRPIGEVLGDDAARVIEHIAAGGRERGHAVLDIPVAEGGIVHFDAVTHWSDGLLILELEPADRDQRLGREGFGSVMRGVVERLEGAETLAELANGVAAEMRDVTGFDRVWVYRFHPDWHGEIIGEAKRDDIETWLGMHYPASDIPAQARALFLRNWVRVIPDVGFTPSPLVPADNPLTRRPTDLGNSLIRSVSPIHIQYLQNMGVTASLVISLIHRGKLWGLISGHHYNGPKRVSAEVRSLCEVLAQALSLQVATVDRLEEREFALQVRGIQSMLLTEMTEDTQPAKALTDGEYTMLDLVSADGGLVLQRDQMSLVGNVPPQPFLDRLIAWLRDLDGDLYMTTELSGEFPPAGEHRDSASGVLAMPLSRDRRDFLLWFRGERKQTVRWAGDPRKPVEIGPDGERRLHPRGSFELWEQEVRGHSEEWRSIQVEAALDIRRGVQDLLVRRAEDISQLNDELEHANEQLAVTAAELESQAVELRRQREDRETLLVRERDLRGEAERANKAKADFLAVMSHELRTPLNAIGGYTQLMEIGMRGPISDEQRADLERIQVNQRHLLGLINSILNFTKLEAGQIQITTEPVDVGDLLTSLEALIGPQMEARNIDLTFGPVPDGLRVIADQEKLRQILLNLATNALKFTPEGGQVMVRCESDEERVRISVEDTGRGIAEDQLENIFEPFIQIDRRFTPTEDQGVGLGLAISRELALAMEGDLRAESRVGEGSTFTVVMKRVEDG